MAKTTTTDDPILQKVNARQGQFAKLWARMDSDLDLLDLKPYEFQSTSGQKVKWGRSVTHNDPGVFGERAISVLSAASPQWEVKLKQGVSDEYTSKVEGFLRGAFAEADRLLDGKMQGPLHDYSVFQTCIRGWAAVRVLLWKDGKNLMFDMLPLDTRHVTWEMGKHGFLWVAYTTQRSPAQIEDEYGSAAVPGGAKGKTVTVTDIWTPQDNFVYSNANRISNWHHDLGYVPVVLLPVRTRPMVGRASDDQLLNFGESIFRANRNLYGAQNFALSVLQTLNDVSFRPPLGFKVKPGGDLPEEYPAEPGTVTEVGDNEGFAELPMGDVRRSAPLFLSIVNAAIQRGSLTYTEYGNLNFTLSAVAIERLEQHRDQVFIPRLRALEGLYKGIAHMLISQFHNNNLEAELGELGEETRYSPSDFDSTQFSVKCSLRSESPEKRLASYSVATTAREFLSPDTVRREVLQLDDPTGEEAKILDDAAAQLSPAIQIHRLARATLRRAEELKGREKKAKQAEARILFWQLRNMGINVDDQGGITPAKKPQGGAPDGFMPRGKVGMPELGTTASGTPSPEEEVAHQAERTSRTARSGFQTGMEEEA